MTRILLALSLALTFLNINQLQAQNLKLDQSMGEAGMVQVQQMIGLYEDENLQKYVSKVGQRLVSKLGEQPFQYHFYVLDMAEPNAFALPAGYIFVSRGILALTNTEDELACILGHEIMHVHKRHSVQQSKKSVIPSILQIPGAVVGSVAGETIGNIIGAPASITSGLILSSYSRAHETEADELGTALAVSAGYNPKAMPAVLNRLHNEVTFIEGKNMEFSYFDTHPYTPNRVSNLKGLIQNGRLDTSKVSKPYLTHSDYIHLYAGMPFDTNPESGILIDSVFLHPSLDFKISFPKDWKTVNTPTFLFSSSKNQLEQIKIQVVSDSLKPKEWGRKTQELVYKSKEYEPSKSQLVKLDGRDGYYLKYQTETEHGTIKMHFFWWQVEGYVLQLAGLSADNKSESIWNSITSLAQLSEKDKKEIVTKEQQVFKVLENESFVDFAARTNSAISIDMIAIINGIEADAVLKEGMELKTAIWKTYSDQD